MVLYQCQCAIRYSPLPKRKLIKPKQAKQNQTSGTRKGAWDEYSRMDKNGIDSADRTGGLESDYQFVQRRKESVVAIRQRLRGLTLDEAIQKAKDSMETARKFAMERSWRKSLRMEAGQKHANSFRVIALQQAFGFKLENSKIYKRKPSIAGQRR